MNGTYKTTLKTVDLDALKGLLNYIDFPKLQDKYYVSWTDDNTAVLKITYDGGKVKIITDYGLQGTYGLRHLHKMLDSIRLNQRWDRVR